MNHNKCWYDIGTTKWATTQGLLQQPTLQLLENILYIQQKMSKFDKLQK